MCMYVCRRLIHRDRRLSCGGTGSRRVAARLGWVGPPRGIYYSVACTVPMRWLGLGRRGAPLSISVALDSFGFIYFLDWLGMPKGRVSVGLSEEYGAADLGHDR
jgi:hypothetical protein